MSSVAAYSLYVPTWTYAGKSVPGFDEDDFTMIVEAGQKIVSLLKEPTTLLVVAGDFSMGQDVELACGFQVSEKAEVTSFQEALPKAQEHVDRTGEGAMVLGTEDSTLGRISYGLLFGSQPGHEAEGLQEKSAYEAIVAIRLDLGEGPIPKGPSLPLSEERHAAQSRFTHGVFPYAEIPTGAYISEPLYLLGLDQRYRLLGNQCKHCSTRFYPQKPFCRKCGGTELKPFRFGPGAEVYSYAAIGKGAAPTEFAPQQDLFGDYVVAVVALEGGARISAQLTEVDPYGVAVGMKLAPTVRYLYRQEGKKRYGLKFKPAL